MSAPAVQSLTGILHHGAAVRFAPSCRFCSQWSPEEPGNGNFKRIAGIVFGSTLWYKVSVTEIERALADIAEVRDRLAGSQRFKGYSALAAGLSGAFALSAGIVQAALIGTPTLQHEGRIYFAIWFVCCAGSILVSYGAIAHWFVNDATARDRWQTRTVGLSMLPSIVLGAAFSLALVQNDLVRVLPGVWFACYGVGLVASRLTIPRGVLPIAGAFVITGIALLFAPASLALQWWINALGFGAGQIAIAVLVAHDV